MKTSNKKNNEGFTLLVAIVVTSLLIIVSFVLANVALKQLLISYSNQESQHAFYNADSGTECAVYWDLDSTTSSFDPYVTFPRSIACNNQTINLVSAPVISGGYSTTTFQFNLTKGCAIIDVVKKVGISTTTKIDSRGYNNCTVGASRRVERGIMLNY